MNKARFKLAALFEVERIRSVVKKERDLVAVRIHLGRIALLFGQFIQTLKRRSRHFTKAPHLRITFRAWMIPAHVVKPAQRLRRDDERFLPHDHRLAFNEFLQLHGPIVLFDDPFPVGRILNPGHGNIVGAEMIGEAMLKPQRIEYIRVALVRFHQEFAVRSLNDEFLVPPLVGLRQRRRPGNRSQPVVLPNYVRQYVEAVAGLRHGSVKTFSDSMWPSSASRVHHVGFI